MKNREIHVGGQLVYYEGDEGYCFHDSETKTDAGIRDIPMTQMVYDVSYFIAYPSSYGMYQTG